MSTPHPSSSLSTPILSTLKITADIPHPSTHVPPTPLPPTTLPDHPVPPAPAASPPLPSPLFLPIPPGYACDSLSQETSFLDSLAPDIFPEIVI